tara:strand:+ start:422 stop:2203 length:1782 start_codon:yes stop_codon:yes gene_type:complete
MAQKAEVNTKINLDSSGFRKGLDRAKSKISRFANSAVASFARVGAAFLGVSLIKNIAQLGLAAGETASKFKSVFGVATDEMSEKIKELRETIPSTTAEMQDALATFASMASAFGLNSKAANMFSVEMVKVAGDIASFHNLPIEEAFTKIRSAVSGEFEPMKQLGIVINEARLKQEGLNLGIFNGVGAMNASQKALAVQSILVKDLGTANGDAAATAESAANKTKFLKKALIEQATEIGTTSLPAINNLVEGLGALLKITTDVMDAVGTKVGELVYGPTDETLEKHRKQNELLRATAQARKELNDEGAFKDRSFFKMPIFSDDETEKMNYNADILEKRIQDILEKKEESSETVVAALEKETEATEKLVEVETDPDREKTATERLQAVQDLIDAAGELTGIETTLTEKQIEQLKKEEDQLAIKNKKLALLKAQASQDVELTNEAQNQLNLEEKIQGIMQSTNVDRQTAIGLAKELAAVEAGADTNQSGYVTPKEQRAQERADRKSGQERRKRERKERSDEVGKEQRSRDKDREDRMTERERANGIDTGKGGSGSSSSKPSGEKAKDTANSKGIEKSMEDTATHTKDILKEIQKNP